jgi:hypothetical protein
LAAVLFETRLPDSAAEAMTLLKGVTLDSSDWERLSAVIPPEFQQYFQKVKQR